MTIFSRTFKAAVNPWFYTSWKHQKTGVFRGRKMGALARNGLSLLGVKAEKMSLLLFLHFVYDKHSIVDVSHCHLWNSPKYSYYYILANYFSYILKTLMQSTVVTIIATGFYLFDEKWNKRHLTMHNL